MKNTHFYVASIMVIAGLAACNGSGTTSATDSSANGLNPGDSSVTTTTTTTVTHHRYMGNFTPQASTKYLDLKTNKQITVRIDTVKGEVVNTETDEPVDLFVEPTTHDTVYGQTGTVVNNYIIKDDTGYRVDTVRIHDILATPATTTDEASKYKEKNKDNKTKEKSKDADGSKEKTKTK